MRLITQIPLVFERWPKPEVDDYGFPIEDQSISTIPTRGSLQPMNLGDRQKLLPEGKWTTDARYYYTATPLKGADTKAGTPPDTCEIGDKVFEVYDLGDWTTNLSGLAHYKVVLIAREPEDE